jgi:hypothetical protein
VLLEIEQKPYCPDSLAALKRYLAASLKLHKLAPIGS